MGNHDQPLPTETLWVRLLKSPSVSQFMDSNDQSLGMPSFAEFVSSICKERDEAPERIIKRAGIERSFGHQIFRGARKPSRDTVLQLAFGFDADIELAQELLRHAQCSALYPRVKRDAIISYCLHHRMSLIQTQNLLAEAGIPLIGGDRGK